MDVISNNSKYDFNFVEKLNINQTSETCFSCESKYRKAINTYRKIYNKDHKTKNNR